MTTSFAGSAIDNLAVGMLLATIAILWVKSLGQALVLFAAQSIMLSAAAFCAGLATHSSEILLAAGLALVVKALVAPALLWVVLQRLPTTHDVLALVGRRTGVALAIVLAVVLARSLDARPFTTAIGAERVLPTAVTVMLIGLQLMVTRRHAITQTLGFLILENGIALAALTATYGMPLVIELGMFLDLLLAVFVIFVYTSRMHVIFGSLDTERMRSLRG